MEIPKRPDDDEERVKSLHKLRILDTPIEKSFEKITRIAKKIFDVPIVNITFIDKDRQWFKSSQVMEPSDVDRDTAFCSHTILGDDVLVVNDTLEDKRFHDNPFVTGDPGVRFYAGCPVREKDDNKVGTLCLIDNKPRIFTKDQLSCLRDLASLVENELQNYHLAFKNEALSNEINEVRKSANIDGLTRLWNRSGINQILQHIYNFSSQNKNKFLVAIIDIDHFKLINDSFGHNVGDKVLREIAQMLVEASRKEDTIGRWGGEEFLLIMHSLGKNQYKILSRIKEYIEKNPIDIKKEEIYCTVTIGATIYDPSAPLTIEELIEKADKNLYRGKNSGRNALNID